MFSKQSFIYTVQLGYCDSDVTVCLLFWNMPIIQGRDVKYPYKGYRYYLPAFRLEAVVSKWLRRCTKEGFLVWKTRRRRFESWHGLFFFFFFLLLLLFVCLCVEMLRRVCSFSAYSR